MRFTHRLFLALRLHSLVELATGMRHTPHVHKTIHRNHRVVAIIAIRLQIAREARQQALGHLGIPTRIVVIQHHRLLRWPTPLQPQVGL